MSEGTTLKWMVVLYELHNGVVRVHKKDYLDLYGYL